MDLFRAHFAILESFLTMARPFVFNVRFLLTPGTFTYLR